MFKRVLLITIFGLLMSNSAFAQEKAPNLPDYTKWELQHYGAHVTAYKGKDTLIYHEDFQNPKGGEEYLVILYEPILEKEYQRIVDAVKEDEDIRRVLTARGLWLAFYFYPDDTAVYVYEQSKGNFMEFYRLWKPRWRFVRALYEDKKGWTEKKLFEFLEEKYQFKY